MEKKYCIATVHIVVEANEKGYAEDAISACLTENLEMSGAILDWGYTLLPSIEVSIDRAKYDEGDFISLINQREVYTTAYNKINKS
jgi:hypothetical protein